MANNSRYVFECSADAHREVTFLFDFIHPTTIALWNLRWQVKGFMAETPSASSEQLSARFASGSGVKGGELKRACIDTPWEQQSEAFARLLLIALISNFEDYVDRLAGCFSTNPKEVKEIASALQFPSMIGPVTIVDGNPQRQKQGRMVAYEQMLETDDRMIGIFLPAISSDRKFVPDKIDNLLLCYRFFKELRNSLAHHGGRANERVIIAHANFVPVANKLDLALDEMLLLPSVAIGQGIQISLRGVIGFSEIILKIIRTYDGEMCSTLAASREVLRRLKVTPGREQFIQNNVAARNRRISKNVDASHMPRCQISARFVDLLKEGGIIPQFWVGGD